MKRVALLGGSFNPVHIGHIAIAGYIAEFEPFDEVWFVLSPLNPFKANHHDICSDAHRLNMLKIAVGAYSSPKLKVCDVELTMPRPSYTIDTLRKLQSEFLDYEFKWVIGSDNLVNFYKWKESEAILNEFGLIVYPREGFDLLDNSTETSQENPKKTQRKSKENIKKINAPIIEISASNIRDWLRSGKDISFFLPHGIARYIDLYNLYRQ